MRISLVIRLLFVFMLCTFSCNYKSSIDQSAFRDSCTGSKIPLKVGIVDSQHLKSWSIKNKFGSHDVAVRVDPTLRRSIYDLMNCHFKDARFVEGIRDSEGLDVHAFCTYDMKGIDAVLEITFKEKIENREIVSYSYGSPIHYVRPSTATGLGAVTAATLFLAAPVTVPMINHEIGEAYKEAVFANIHTALNGINDKIKSDNTLVNYAAHKDKVPITTAHSSEQPPQQVPSKASTPPSLYDDLMACVVVIKTSKGIGSGFLVSKSGLIVTNAHVLAGYGKVSIIMRDKTALFGSVLAIDTERDLALISVAGSNYPSLAIGDLDKEGAIGNEVVAIGVPEGLGWSMSKGIVSAIRQIDNMTLVQTDTAINKGNSGGPLISVNTGRVIGINTFGFKKEVATGLNFAVASSELKKAFPKYMK